MSPVTCPFCGEEMECVIAVASFYYEEHWECDNCGGHVGFDVTWPPRNWQEQLAAQEE